MLILENKLEVKLATVLHHSTMVPQLPQMCFTLQVNIIQLAAVLNGDSQFSAKLGLI